MRKYERLPVSRKLILIENVTLNRTGQRNIKLEWIILEADDDEPLPTCSGMCSISDFKKNLIPHAEAGLEQPFTVDGGTSQFVYKGKYQVDFLKKATSFLNKLDNAAQDVDHCAVEAVDVECLCTQDLNAVIDGLKNIAKKTLLECNGEFLNDIWLLSSLSYIIYGPYGIGIP